MRYIVILIYIVLNINSTMIKDSDKKIVIDTTTRLMWDDDYLNVKREQKSWIDSVSFCENLDNDFTDWRLPSINELYSIIDLSTSNPSINQTFEKCASSRYWSSTTSGYADKIYAWAVDFNTSQTNSMQNKTNEYFHRCVRDY